MAEGERGEVESMIRSSVMAAMARACIMGSWDSDVSLLVKVVLGARSKREVERAGRYEDIAPAS